MPTIVSNLGPANNTYFGRPGYHEIINLGGGTDIAVTGGGGTKEINTGNDHSLDKVYSETLPGKGMPFIGGHRYLNGVAQEFHEYHLGMRDESRISIANWKYTEDHPGAYMMVNAKVPGLFVIHGPGGNGTNATWIKSFDPRPGAQQLSMAGDDIAVNYLTGRSTKVAGGYDFEIDTIRLVGNTDNPANDGQTVLLDFRQHVAAVRDYATVHLDANTAAERLEAVQDFVNRGSDGTGHDWLLTDG